MSSLFLNFRKTAKRLKSHTVVRNAFLMYVVQFSGYIFPLIALPYLAHKLSTEMFGWVAFAQTFNWYFITLTDYGFNLTATRAIAIAQDDRTAISRTYSAVLTAKVLLTILGLVIMLAVVVAAPRLRPYLALFTVSFLSVIGNLLFPMWLFQGMQKMEHVAIRDFLAKIISLVTLFLFVHGDQDYLIAAGTQSGGQLLAGIVGLLTVRPKLGVRFQIPLWSEVREQFIAGWPAFLSLSVSGYAVVTNTVIIGLRAPVSEIAYYNAAQRLIAAMRSMVSPLSTAIYPHASQKAVRSEADVVEFVRKYALIFLAPFLVVGILLIVASPWALPRFLGEKFHDSVPVLQIMALTPALLVLIQVYSTYYMLACGYDKEWMRIMLTTVVVNFAVLLPLMFVIRGSLTLAITGLVSETSAAFLYWRFYRGRAMRLREATALT